MLAQASERAGLDLVTFQDHPYNVDFLETWTLLSWVAAATERITVAGNVLNSPMRNPAMLARQAASLDRLSGGRLALGLGAGGFWDAITTMNVDRLTPAESVDALSEAIDVIRQLTDTRTRGMVRHDGEHYQVVGARRGPAPAHDVPIWIGALKPRMLRLVGTKGDGWLPSLPYLKDGDLTRGNAVIDEAAQAAGRHPAQIRRMLNVSGQILPSPQGRLQGPVDQWVDELTELAITEGVGTFIAMADDPNFVHTFGEEIAPAVREQVAAERSKAGTKPAASQRGTAALAARREAIDYEAVPDSLAASAVEPGDRRYDSVRHNYLRSGSPGLVLMPSNSDQVIEAIEYAKTQEVSLGVRSAGHGISGRSTNDGGIVVDVRELNDITVLDGESGRVRVGAGATWGDVAHALAPSGLAITSGDYGGVGVGGIATTGGIGLLGRQQGLTIDRVLAYEVVTADGQLVRASAEENADLFWALRGAGGNFGVVTAVELAAGKLDQVVFSMMTLGTNDLTGMLQAWGEAVENAPRELTSNMYVSGSATQAQAQLMTVWAGDDTDAAVRSLESLANAGDLLAHQAHLLPYAGVMGRAETQHSGGGDPSARSGLVSHLDRQTATAISELAATGVSQFNALRATGGAALDVLADATAYAHRHQNFSVSAMGRRTDELNEAWDSTVGGVQEGSYLSFDTDTRPERLAEAFPEQTLARLRSLKARYDSGNLFNANFPIPPAD